MPPPSATSLKLDIKTKERVQRLADARRRSPHWVMREAIEQYVEREEKREQCWKPADSLQVLEVGRPNRREDRSGKLGP